MGTNNAPLFSMYAETEICSSLEMYVISNGSWNNKER